MRKAPDRDGVIQRMAEQDDNSAALAEQVDRLRLVVEELQAGQAAQRADDAGGDRWQARLSSLETRLSMVESTFRSEAERVEGAVRSVEALSTSLRDLVQGAEAVSTIGHDLEKRIEQLDAAIAANRSDPSALAAEVGRRVEAVTQAPARAMTESLTEHLQRTAERERTVAAALESLTGQLNQFTTTLAGEIRRASQDSADASRSELDAAISAVREAAEAVANAGDVTSRVDLAIAGVGELRQELAAVATRLDPASRLEAITEAAARIDARVAQSGSTIAQQVREVLADRLATGDPTPVLEAMRADLRHTVRAISEDRTPIPELQGAIEALTRDITTLGARVDELRARSEGTTTDLAALSGVPATLAKLADDLQPLATLPASIDGFGGAVEGAVAVHRRSAAAVETLQEAIDAARAEIAGAAGATQHLTERLDEATRLAAEANRVAFETTMVQQRDLEASRLADQDRRLTNMASTIDALAARPSAESALLPVLQALQGELASVQAAALGREQLDEALTTLASSLTEGPALPTVDDLHAAVDTLAIGINALRDAPAPATPATPEQLDAAVARLEERLAEVPAPVSTADLDAAVAGLRLVLGSLPVPPTVDEVAAAVRVTMPEQLATTYDIEGGITRLLTAVDARLSGNVLEDFRAEIGRIVEFRAEMLSAIAELRKSAPAATATGDDVQAAAEGVVGAVRDAVSGAVGLLHSDVELVQRAVERLDALDAIGRLVHHAISSLHLIEESTVGVSSGSVRARTEIAAAIAELEAARERRATSPVT